MTTDAKQLRADALRNRQRILEVAQETFASEGIGTPIDLIAQRAGVGIGTLYRHFPTKEALYAAVVLSRLEAAAADARSLARARDPGAAFFDFLGRFVKETSAKRDLFDALGAAGAQYKDSFGDAKQQLHEALGKLLARAQRAGEVRRDATIADVFALIHGPFVAIRRPHAVDAAAPERLFAIVCDGLRARASRPR